MIRGPVAEINLSAVAHNFQAVRQFVQNRPVIAVVKADAYGHGAVEVSKKLLEEGVSYLAVAFTDEAKELRESGITAPIIVLFDRGEIKDFLDYNLTPVICSTDTAFLLSDEAEKRNAVIKAHVKIDTGMGRLGLQGEHVISDLIHISEAPGLEITGLLSHFSEADLSDRSYATLQLERFTAIRDEISKRLKRKIFSHIANSAAVLAFEQAYLDGVRPGIMLYGYSPLTRNPDITLPSNNPSLPSFTKRGDREESSSYQTSDALRISLIPAMTVKARILCMRKVPAGTPISYGRTFVTNRPSRIGVIAMGYADGYSRLFSNNAHVLAKGQRVPVVGRVCMDLTMVDLTDTGSMIEEGDEVIIIGGQGNERITADELACKANTISYEILTSLGGRAARRYVETH